MLTSEASHQGPCPLTPPPFRKKEQCSSPSSWLSKEFSRYWCYTLLKSAMFHCVSLSLILKAYNYVLRLQSLYATLLVGLVMILLHLAQLRANSSPTLSISKPCFPVLHEFLGLPTGLFPETSKLSFLFSTPPSASFLTCPNYCSLLCYSSCLYYCSPTCWIKRMG